jgi:hypothetical protein
MIGHAMLTSPWPAPAIIGVASIPVLLVMRWQWRVLRGPQLHVEDAGVHAGTDGHPVHFARPIRADAPVKWALLE